MEAGGEAGAKRRKAKKRKRAPVKVLSAHVGQKCDMSIVKEQRKKTKGVAGERGHGALLISKYHELIKAKERLNKEPQTGAVKEQMAAIQRDIDKLGNALQPPPHTQTHRQTDTHARARARTHTCVTHTCTHTTPPTHTRPLRHLLNPHALPTHSRTLNQGASRRTRRPLWQGSARASAGPSRAGSG